MDKETKDGSLLRGVGDIFMGRIDSEVRRLAVCLLATFLIGLTAHQWGFLHMTVSQDSLSEFYWSMNWKFFLGRYAEPVVRYLMGEMIVLPWLTGLSGLLLLSGAVYLISRMFEVDKVWENVVLGGICVANGAMTTLIATYVHDFAGDMLALLLAVYGAYLWVRMGNRFSWKKTLLGGLCLFVSFCIYQAYLAVTATLICIYAIRELLRGRTAREVLRGLLRAVPMCLLALGAYAGCVLVMKNVLNYGLGGNGGSAMNRLDENLLKLASLVGMGYLQVARDLFLPHWSSVKAVFGPTGWLICLINIALAAKCLMVLISVFKVRKMKMPEILLALALTALLPMCMSCVSIVSEIFHYLLRYGAYLYYLLVLVLLAVEREYFPERRGKKRQLAVLCLTGFVILCNIQVANTAYEKKDLEQKSTLSTMTRVIDRLENYEGYEFGKSEVAIAGVISSHQVRLRVGEVDCLFGLGPNSQIADNGLEDMYFKVFLNYPMNLCSGEKEQAIMETEQFKAMGSFPARDCIATIDGVIVVKMSDADFDYTKFVQ